MAVRVACNFTLTWVILIFLIIIIFSTYTDLLIAHVAEMSQTRNKNKIHQETTHSSVLLRMQWTGKWNVFLNSSPDPNPRATIAIFFHHLSKAIKCQRSFCGTCFLNGDMWVVKNTICFVSNSARRRVRRRGCDGPYPGM